jgi:hypothetical protein
MRTWIKIDDETPSTDREVFAWMKGYGIYYTARWRNGSFNLPWAPTHWMERPGDPE